jgi:host factor-I protein
MSDKPLDLQNLVLNQCRRSGVSVSLYLLKGVRLQGTIGGFDSFVLTLRREGEEQLVYKHGLATLAARVDLDRGEVSKASGGGEGLQHSILEKHMGKAIDAFLVNGVRLTGMLVGHDRFTVLIEGPNKSLQLVYKHALSSIAGAGR